MLLLLAVGCTRRPVLPTPAPDGMLQAEHTEADPLAKVATERLLEEIGERAGGWLQQGAAVDGEAPAYEGFKALEDVQRPRSGVLGSTGLLASWTTESLYRSLGFRTTSVYGSDDRIDVGALLRAEAARPTSHLHESDNIPPGAVESVLLASEAVALVVRADEIREQPDGTYRLTTATYDQQARRARGVGLCTEQWARFGAQPTAGLCTAWLLSPQRVVTARHCLGGRPVDGLHVVFGWRRGDDGAFLSEATPLSADQVYRARSLVPREMDARNLDIAVIELDRAVSTRAPLALRRSGSVSIGERLYILGCPRGLPLKYAGRAQVRTSNGGPTTFEADLDAFQGNSGSPVFSAVGHDVVGLLIRGRSDWGVRGDPPCVEEVRLNLARGAETCLHSKHLAPYAQR